MDKTLHREGRKVSAPVRREIVKELNATAYLLYEYYVEKAEAPDFDLFNDTLVAQVLGLTPRTVKATRLALQNADFILLTKQTAGDIEAHDYIIGKERVIEHKAQTDSSTDNPTQ